MFTRGPSPLKRTRWVECGQGISAKSRPCRAPSGTHFFDQAGGEEGLGPERPRAYHVRREGVAGDPHDHGVRGEPLDSANGVLEMPLRPRSGDFSHEVLAGQRRASGYQEIVDLDAVHAESGHKIRRAHDVGPVLARAGRRSGERRLSARCPSATKTRVRNPRWCGPARCAAAFGRWPSAAQAPPRPPGRARGRRPAAGLSLRQCSRDEWPRSARQKGQGKALRHRSAQARPPMRSCSNRPGKRG